MLLLLTGGEMRINISIIKMCIINKKKGFILASLLPEKIPGKLKKLQKDSHIT